ncbi:MAG TPA: hypothetical protein VKZ53_15255 [Candidatus Angelobacter sp.]|nr:hypothetical protein [Candidatus Angelobacter sp.]
MIEPPNIAEQQQRAPDTRMMPPSFDPDYVHGVIREFLKTAIYQGETPLLPMIDFALSKEAAIPPHIFGMLYDSWKPDTDKEGLSVFLQAYGDRGEHNERKRIYFSAQTPDLYLPMYSGKVQHFLDRLFDKAHREKPLMHFYFEEYFDLYWDLHLGVKGRDVPADVRQIGKSFMAVLGYWYPTLQIVHDNYMQVRQLRQKLKDWIDRHMQDIIDGRMKNSEKTMVHYWVKNGELGPNFRRQDVVFECFHNFLAFSQWGNTIYNIMLRLQQTGGDKAVRTWFEKTMKQPDETDQNAFTRLDRFVMELFRTISPNAGSYSVLNVREGAFGTGYTGNSGMITPHPESSRNPIHWKNPNEFDPDRYIQAVTSEQNDHARSKAMGLEKCPFEQHKWPVKDGRKVEIANSSFGAVYPRLDGKASPICDEAGYAPFGFGYRRCAGEFLTVSFIKDFLRKVWADKISFKKLSLEEPALLPVGPLTVVPDNIGFHQG